MFKKNGRHRRAHQLPQGVLAAVFMLSALPLLLTGCGTR